MESVINMLFDSVGSYLRQDSIFTGVSLNTVLIFCLTGVSTYHVAVVLVREGKEPWPVAILVAVLVDLGFFNAVMFIFRRPGGVTLLTLVFLAAGSFFFSFYFHWKYYGNILYAFLVPFSIISLAIIGFHPRRVYRVKRKKKVQNGKN